MNYPEHPSEHIAHTVDKAVFLRQLSQFLKVENIVSAPEAMRPYDCDGMSSYRVLPWLVVLPETIEQAQAVLLLCHQHGVPVVARGAGTGLSGGALPVANGVLLSLAKFTRILAIDPENRCARVQPGVRNLAISEAAAPFGLYYAPDPSSQIACTIGGNVAENAGGVHCLKYGLTVHNLLALKLLTVEGELITLGGTGLDSAGYDLSPDYYCMDGTIPRRRLAEVLRSIATLSEAFGLAVANVFHAGDGNLHPLILYDANQPGELARAEAFGSKILELCVAAGGTITGEHGVDMEKLKQMCMQFSSAELRQFHELKAAFDPYGGYQIKAGQNSCAIATQPPP